ATSAASVGKRLVQRGKRKRLTVVPFAFDSHAGCGGRRRRANTSARSSRGRQATGCRIGAASCRTLARAQTVIARLAKAVRRSVHARKRFRAERVQRERGCLFFQSFQLPPSVVWAVQAGESRPWPASAAAGPGIDRTPE